MMRKLNKQIIRKTVAISIVLLAVGIANNRKIYAASYQPVSQVMYQGKHANRRFKIRKRFISRFHKVRRIKNIHPKSHRQNVKSRKIPRRVNHKSVIKHPKRSRHSQQRGSLFHVINQRGSALTNEKYYDYVKDHNNYPVVDNSMDTTVPALNINDYANNYAHTVQTIQNNNGTDLFRTDRFLPTRSGKYDLYSPQGLVVSPNGRTVCVSYNASSSNDGNSKIKRLKPGMVQIIRYNLEPRHGDYAQIIKTGPVFNGGHGQAFTYNSRAKKLWLLNNLFGATDRTGAEVISPKTMQPISRINFHLPTVLGDNLVFDGRGNAINVDEAESHQTITSEHALKLFKGQITPKRVGFNLIQGIKSAPGEVIQSAAYDPHNNRIYVVSDCSIISFPANRLGHLSTKDIKQTLFNTQREFEGLSFDHDGYAYLLSNRSPEIFKSIERDF